MEISKKKTKYMYLNEGTHPEQNFLNYLASDLEKNLKLLNTSEPEHPMQNITHGQYLLILK